LKRKNEKRLLVFETEGHLAVGAEG